MVEVSKDEFYAALFADPRDIMPARDSIVFGKWPFSAKTTFRVVATRAVWGECVTYGPGANTRDRYWLVSR